MKNFVLIFLFALAFCNCTNVKTQQISENKPKPTRKTPIGNGTGFSSGDQGNPKFRLPYTKYYLGCWQPEKRFKPRLEPKSDIFYITEETIQTSKMSEPIPYEEVNAGNNEDYFVLHLKSKDESNQLTPYIYIFMALDTEVDLSTLEKFATENNIKEQSKTQWSLAKIDCQKVLNKSEKK